jgi:hypothetical protein
LERVEVMGRVAQEGLKLGDPAATPAARPRAQKGLSLRRGQAVLTVVGNDRALLTSFVNGELGSAFGTLGTVHDVLAELVVA